MSDIKNKNNTIKKVINYFLNFKKKEKDKIVINENNDVIVYKNGLIHNENGPAIKYKDGSMGWYIKGKKHREDGPAMEYPDGYREWYINGIKITESEFNVWKTTTEGNGLFINDKGDKFWYKNDKLHREDGPAVESSESKQWWINGRLHRVNAPALEYSNFDKFWYFNGELHREDGPAMEYANGNQDWYQSGEKMAKEKIDAIKLYKNLKYDLPIKKQKSKNFKI